MSNVALLRTELQRSESEKIHLGPASVVRSVAPDEIEVQLPDGVKRVAKLALQLPYDPVEHDQVLVIANADGCYVIGILWSQGTTRLEIAGDVSLHAVGGELKLSGDRAVRIESPELSVVARKVGMVADAVLQRFATLRQRVSELLETHAGQSRTLVDGSTQTTARSATIQTQETVVINGKAIHLG